MTPCTSISCSRQHEGLTVGQTTEKLYDAHRSSAPLARRQRVRRAGGVIVLFDGAVQSWVNTLRNPNHWQPGCIAIDEQGRTWTAIAGNQGDGALMWLPNDPV